ncbi:MAG: ABC transporter permease [Acidobacteria bacterium]|nr:ABC transporter permease [Acidobacteriota bacterium]
MLRRLRFIVNKEMTQTFRDRATFRIMVLTPVLQLLIYGYVVTTDIRLIPTVLCDHDRSQASRQLVQRFTTSGYFELVAEVDAEGQIDTYLDRGLGTMAILIPPRYSEQLDTGRTARVQLLFDGSNSNRATLAQTYASSIIAEAGFEVVFERFSRMGVRVEKALLDTEPRIWYNPELKSLHYMVPGVICALLLQLLVPLTSLGIVRERERGTIEQLRVTPIRPTELILGKTLPGVVIGYFNVFVILLVGRFWFGIPLKGSLLTLLFTSGLFIISALALGIFISTITATQEQAMFTGQFLIVPNLLLSGFMFPISSMPQPMQYLTYLIPLRYFLEIVRGIFLKGVGLDVLWPQALALIVFGSAMLALSIRRFGRN